MHLAQYDDMVHALASDRSDQPFGEAILPRRAWGDGLVTDAHGAQSACDGSAVDSIPINSFQDGMCSMSGEAFGASIEFRSNRLRQGSYLRDLHATSGL